jgi:hypothetical protein
MADNMHEPAPMLHEPHNAANAQGLTARYGTLHDRYLKPYLPPWQETKANLWPFAASNRSPLLYLLLITDVGFIVLHLLFFYTGFPKNELFSLRRDKGYPEFFQYIEEFWIGLLLAWQALRVLDARYLVWSGLFAYMLADDYLMFHENFGAFAANTLGISEHIGLRGQDFGELSFYLLVGGTFVVLLLIAYRYGSESFRRNSIALLVLLLLFAFFAVVADLLHIVLDVDLPSLDHIFDVIEDGGEMIVMSLITWFAYRLAQDGTQQG